jgi:hypothetical protein
MPRKARIDTPGAMHHLIARGIKRGEKLIAEKKYSLSDFLKLYN